MITLSSPTLVNSNGKARLSADVDIDGRKATIWCEVDDKYARYLCHERSDAFLVGILNYAMRHGHDIECSAPVGEDLYYQITHYLIDALVKGSRGPEEARLRHITIHASIDPDIMLSAGAVATGMSCGVDSLHALSRNADTEFVRHNITHLTFHNVGAHGDGDTVQKILPQRLEHTEAFCKKYGWELVVINSNLMDAIPQNHGLANTYQNCFAVFALQKLFSVFYYASDCPFAHFTLENNNTLDCSHYDLLLLDVFSVPNLRFYSEGATRLRIEKLEHVSGYPPSHDFLSVCFYGSKNCGRCEKCVRTMLALDALGTLDLYASVFDVDLYRRSKKRHLRQLLRHTHKRDRFYVELYPYFRDDISIGMRVRVCVGRIVTRLRRSGTLLCLAVPPWLHGTHDR